MKWHRAVGVAVVVLVAGGCVGARPSVSEVAPTNVALPSTVADICAGVALENGPDHHVVGSFSMTVQGIRTLQKFPVSPVPWPSLSADHAAILCYIDGPIPKGPPPYANGSVPPSYDRGIYAIVDGESSPVEFGYRDHLPVVGP
jgi:hypothetical protein